MTFTSRTRVYIAGPETLIGQALVRRLAGQVELPGLDDGPDLRDAAAVDRFFAESRPEYVVVAAGRTAGILGNQMFPAELMLDNLQVAAHVIPSAWRHGTRSLLYLTSSCTYPKLAPQPLRVESLWTGPVEATSEAYAVAKLAGMRLCEAFRSQYDARFIIAIQGDAFGPGDDFDPANSHVVPGLIRRMHDAKVAHAPFFEIWGTGSPRREFMFADDVADAALFVIENYDAAAPINLGTGTTTSILELAQIVREVVQYEGELRFDSSRPDGMPLKGLDSTVLHALGWRPSSELKAAIAHTYQWFVANAGVAPTSASIQCPT